MRDAWSGSGIDHSLGEPTTWDGLWKQHFQEYQGDLRHAYYIAAMRRRKERRILEIAAGSFRDVAALNSWGFFCEGIDFSTESIERAWEMLPGLCDRIKKMDAGCLDYPDGAFDLTYHAGFWGCFDDEQIAALGAEQARVTASRMVATVHNAHNHSFREQFAAWSEKDVLFRLRFFEADEIASLMRHFCRHVTVLPVTGPRMDRLIRRGPAPGVVRWAYRLYGRCQGFENSQRLMCIGDVRR